MKKLFILALAVAGVAMIPTSPARAEVPATVPQTGVTALPATVQNNYVVLVEGGRRYYRARHWRWVNGRRQYYYTRVWL
jgi:hypothetical protein